MEAKTNVKFSDNVHKFAELTPGVGQQEYQDFIYSSLVTCTKSLSNSNSFVVPAAKQKGHKYNIVKMKYKGFNKLRTVIAETETLFYNELLLSNPNLVGFLGVRFEVGGVKLSPCLKLVRIMLETSNLVRKYTPICSFRKYTF